MANKARKGLKVTPDDLTVGEYFAIVGCKAHDDPVPIAGMAFKVVAINLPFLVGKLAVNPELPTITLDVRYVDFMRVDEDYVKAQTPAEQAPTTFQDALQAAMRKS